VHRIILRGVVRHTRAINRACRCIPPMGVLVLGERRWIHRMIVVIHHVIVIDG